MRPYSIAMMLLSGWCCAGAVRAAEPAATTSWAEPLFGPQLVQADGKRVPVATLQGKVVGVYFAARSDLASYTFHDWLLRLRNRAVETGLPFEVVFVSHDPSAADMLAHMKDRELTWPAVPFDKERIAKLDERFKVGTLPVLAVLNAQGELVATNAVKTVQTAGSKAIELWQKAKPLPQP